MRTIKFLINYISFPLLWGSLLSYFVFGNAEDTDLAVLVITGIVVIVSVFNTVVQLLISYLNLHLMQRWFLASGLSLICIWFLFKIQHWPGATISLWVAILFLVVFVTLVVLRIKRRSEIDSDNQD